MALKGAVVFALTLQGVRGFADLGLLLGVASGAECGEASDEQACGTDGTNLLQVKAPTFTEVQAKSLLVAGPYSSRFEQVCMAGATHRALFHEYAAFHRECRKSTACLSKALVWQCGEHDDCGGLGDEIRGLVFTLLTAMALKRPFFVRWERMGQDVLHFFTLNSIDVRPPAELPGCQVFSHMVIDDKPDPRVWVGQAKALAGCATWVTNMDLFGRSGRLAAEVLPAMKDIQLEAVIGCGMNYLFKPLSMTAAERTAFAGLPDNFTAIHLRCDDRAMKSSPAADEADEAELALVKSSLQCARKLQSKTVVFLSGSESAKKAASRLSKSMGLKVVTTKARARHIDHDRHQLSAEAFRAALWSDFVVLQHASTLIRAGAPVSGFSGAAASMGLMPVEKMWRIAPSTGDLPVCVPDQTFRGSASFPQIIATIEDW